MRAVPGFTAKYGVDRLVWLEAHETLESALIRERQIKKWKRDWKINLIEYDNPRWIDLYQCLPSARWIPAFAGIRIASRRRQLS